MRIIAGELKGKRLATAPGRATRPTAGRVRESMFNICASRVEGAIVLDLFAGTGAFGIEALSRGAASAAFIDVSTAAVQIIKKNITACSLEKRAKAIKWDIIKNLNCIRSASPRFNLVFMDPPYSRNAIAPALKNLADSNALADGATLIIEHSDLESIPDNLDCFKMTDQRKYGKTLVSFLTYTPAP